jgi:thiamine-monophosphate kinase
VRLTIDPASPALAEAINHWRPLAKALGLDPGQWVLGGGEDHALLATFPSEARLPDGWHGIGQVADPGPDGPGLTITGEAPAKAGWDHFA